MHNSSGADRVAMVCRYAPWWLSTQEFSGNQVGYLSVSDWEALPERLQPLLRCSCGCGWKGCTSSIAGLFGFGPGRA